MGCEFSIPTNDMNVIGKSERLRKGIGQTERLLSKLEQDALTEDESQGQGGQENNVKDAPKLNDAGHLSPCEIEKRTSNSDENSEIILGTAKNTLKVQYAHWTQRGYYPDDPHKENQDEYSICTNFAGSTSDALFAVYDGHGAEGHACSRFSKKHLPKLLTKYVKNQRVKRYKEKLAAEKSDIKKFFDPSKWPLLGKQDVESCCKKAFLECNQAMHDDPKVLDKLSGTTGITAFFHGDLMTISNVGDSRAVLGHRVSTETFKDILNGTTTEGEEENVDADMANAVIAIPLSRDQTPYRKDERERVQKCGACVMSIDQMEGKEEIHDNWGDMVLGKDIDFDGDPPRIWAKGQNYPGCAFTRSLGDNFSEQIGINAEPEMLTTQLTKNDEILVVASDGIFEFVTNQRVIDICVQCATPLEACEKLVKVSYNEWLKHEKRTDDITVIVCFLKSTEQPPSSDKGGSHTPQDITTTEDLIDLARNMYGTSPANWNSSKTSLTEETEKKEISQPEAAAVNEVQRTIEETEPAGTTNDNPKKETLMPTENNEGIHINDIMPEKQVEAS